MTRPPKPIPHQGDLANLPSALQPLTREKRWVLWKYRLNGQGKWTKPPFRTDGKMAKTDDPETWHTYQQVLGALNNPRERFEGIGFCLLGHPTVRAIDIDDGIERETRAVKPTAKKLLQVSGDTYAEVTVSGLGYRIIGIGDRSDNLHGKFQFPDGVSAEPYRCVDTGRYITISGKALPGRGEVLTDIEAIIDQVRDEGEQVREATKPRKEKTSGAAPITGQLEPEGDTLPDSLVKLLEMDGPGDYPSRSELMFAFLTACVRMGVPRQVVHDSCLDPRYAGKAIYQHCHEQAAKPSAYVVRQMAKAWEAVPDIVSPFFSDDHMALLFSERFADELRFVALWGRWLQWGGVRWIEDNTLKVFDLARVMCREIAVKSNKPKKELASAKTVAAVEKLARADRRHAATAEQWDIDIEVINEAEEEET